MQSGAQRARSLGAADRCRLLRCRRLRLRAFSQELSLPCDTSSSQEGPESSLRSLSFPTGAFPYLAELTIDHVMQPGYNYADEFEFGLDLILDGLERLKWSRRLATVVRFPTVKA